MPWCAVRTEAPLCRGVLALLALVLSGCSAVLGLDGLVADRVECTATCGTPGCGECPATSMVDASTIVGPFRIDAFEVSNADYKIFLDTGPSTGMQRQECTWNDSFEPGLASQVALDNAALEGVPVELDPNCPGRLESELSSGGEHHAATCVDWCDAAAYCTWAGKRLCGKPGGGMIDATDPSRLIEPTSEWFGACSAGDTRIYPYGNTYAPSTCNDSNSRVEDVGFYPACEGGVPGLFDMSGNVDEWYDACNRYVTHDSLQNCYRNGGAYWADEVGLQCQGSRDTGRFAQSDSQGFRCCASL